MRSFKRRSVMAGVLGVAACSHWGVGPGGDVELAVVGARLYAAPDAPPVDNATILIGDERILAVDHGREAPPPSSARVIDARDCAVTAGFWNSHVHLLSRELLHADQRGDAELAALMERLFTRWGFTTVFDVASILANTNLIRRRIHSGDVRGPSILTAGEPFYPLIGTPFYVREFLRRRASQRPRSQALRKAWRAPASSFAMAPMGSSCSLGRLSAAISACYRGAMSTNAPDRATSAACRNTPATRRA